jgi:hypothetical protein
VPGRATTQFALLEQHHVRPAKFGQVVGDARADDAATDDDNTGLRGDALRLRLDHARV